MRVLLMHDYNKPVGGACQLFYDEARLLRSRGHEVHLFTLDNFEYSKPYFEISKIETVFLEPRNPFIWFFQKYFSWNLFKTFQKTIKSFMPDIIHIHQNLKSALSILLATNSFNIPVVHTIHDINPVCLSGWGVDRNNNNPCLNKPLFQCAKNGCLPLTKFLKHAPAWKIRQLAEKRYVDLILVPSKFLLMVLRKQGYEKVEYFPYFVYPANKKPRSKPDKPTILYVGGLVAIKGVTYLIQAAKYVLNTFPNTNFLIIGKGPEKEKLKYLTKELKIKDKIKFLGEVPRNKLNIYYRDTTILVLPSICMENSPVSIIEAFSFGIPVVASKVGGIPELVKNKQTGFLFEPRNSQDLADKIKELLNNTELLQKMSFNTRKFWSLKYTQDKHYTELMKFYSHVLKKRKNDQIV